VKIVQIAVAALVLVLAGCTPTPALSPSARPSASPNPTATLASAPAPALPLTCAQLFTIGSVQSHLHANVSTKVDETHVGPELYDLAVLQAGGTECTWGGDDMTDSSYDTGVVLAILPDAATEFAARAIPTSGDPVTGTIGNSSEYTCSSGAWCDGDVLAGQYWISFIVGDADSPDNGPTPATVEAIMKPIVDAVSKAGGSVSPWARPKTPFDGAALCTAASAPSIVSAAMGTTVTAGPGYDFSGLFGTAASRAGFTFCAWSSAHGQTLSIQTLPAGAWVYPRVAAAPPLWTLIGHPTAIDVPGSNGAVSGCGEHCDSLVSFGKSLVQFSLGDTQDQPTATAITQKLIAGIAAP